MATAQMVSQMGMMAGDAFTDSNGELDFNQLIGFTESINKQLAISGVAGTAGADAAIYQLTQAMASGVLRGEELNSVMEQAPMIAQNIAKYMGVSVGELRKLASEGLVTSEVVKSAMLNALTDVNDSYSKIPTTFGQAMTLLKNEALAQLGPLKQSWQEFMSSDTFAGMYTAAVNTIPKIIQYVQNLINKFAELGNSPGTKQLLNDLGRMFTVLGMILAFVVDIAVGFVDNWQWISPIIWGVVAAVLAYNAALLGSAIATGIKNIADTVQEVQAYRNARAALAHSSALTAQEIATHKATIAQAGLNTALLASPVTWVILAIIALIAIIFIVVGVINKATDSSISAVGVIVGAVFWMASVIWNIIVGVINAVLQFVWTYFVEPWIGIIEWILNVANGGFNSFGDVVANLVGNIIGWFLSLGTVVTKIIDAIFGTNWTAGLNGLRDEVIAWGKNESAITLDRTAPTIESLTGGAVGRWDSTDAYTTGYEVGQRTEQAISDALGGFDLDELTSGANKLAQQQQEQNDILTGSGGGVVVQGEVSITDEDIKLLKDVAQAEWVNKYTTLRPEMTVTFGDIHETADANQLLAVMEDMIEEAYASALGG